MLLHARVGGVHPWEDRNFIVLRCVFLAFSRKFSSLTRSLSVSHTITSFLCGFAYKLLVQKYVDFGPLTHPPTGIGAGYTLSRCPLE